MQGMQEDAVDAGVQRMKEIWRDAGSTGVGGGAHLHGYIAPGAADVPFQGLGEQRGVCRASSSGAPLTCPQHSPAHLSPIPALMGGSSKGPHLNTTSL